MVSVYSISAEGISAACRTLNEAAQRIAARSVNARRDSTPGAGSNTVSGRNSQEIASSPAKVDLVTELFTVKLAKIDAEANLRVMSTQQDLEHEILNLLA
jgi:hypothetical protein